MTPKGDQAIVLRARDYREADLLVSLFTKEEGKINGIAKGAKKSKKRFGPALEIGSLINLVYENRPERELVLLKEASSLGPLPHWRSSWVTIAVASFALELAFKTLPEHQAAHPKFNLLKVFLETLEENDARSSLLAFQERWLSLLGWEPDTKICGMCGEIFATKGVQKILDHYWLHVLGKPLVSRKILDLVQ